MSRAIGLPLAAFLSLVLQPTSASAYCVDTDGQRNFAGDLAVDNAIPVKIVTSGAWSVLDDAAKPDDSEGLNVVWPVVYGAVQQSIAMWNRNADSPYFTYGGTVATPSPAVVGGFPDGAVYILSFPYSLEQCPSAPACSFDAVTAVADIIELNSAGVPGDPLAAPQWSNARPINATTHDDLVATITHELGHSLQLEDQYIACDCKDCVSDGIKFPDDVKAVMNNALTRLPTRDDIEGLTFLWGEGKRSPTGWETDSASYGSFQGWPLYTWQSNTAPALASSQNSSFLGAYTFSYYYNDRLYVAWETGSGLTYKDAGSGTAGKTYQRPSIAFGDPDTLMIAWVEEADKLDHSLNVRTRSKTSGTWSSNVVSTVTRYPEIGLGYDPASDRFLLSAIDGPSDLAMEPKIVALTHGGTFVSNTNLTSSLGNVVSMSKPVCELSGDCFFAYATSAVFTPVLRLAEGYVNSSDTFVVTNTRSLGVYTISRVDLAIGDDEWPDLFPALDSRFVVSYFTTNTYNYVRSFRGFGGSFMSPTFAVGAGSWTASVGSEFQFIVQNPGVYRVASVLP